MTVEVRRANFSEKELTEKVARACGKYVRSFLGMRDPRRAYEDGEVWLAFVDGKVAGFAHCKLLKREPFASLYELGTLPEFRGRGVGRELMKASSGGRAIRLVVDPENETAVLYYLKQGLQLDYPQPVPTRSGKSLVWRMSGVLR